MKKLRNRRTWWWVLGSISFTWGFDATARADDEEPPPSTVPARAPVDLFAGVGVTDKASLGAEFAGSAHLWRRLGFAVRLQTDAGPLAANRYPVTSVWFLAADVNYQLAAPTQQVRESIDISMGAAIGEFATLPACWGSNSGWFGPPCPIAHVTVVGVHGEVAPTVRSGNLLLGVYGSILVGSPVAAFEPGGQVVAQAGLRMGASLP